jgi:hypothetical protein
MRRECFDCKIVYKTHEFFIDHIWLDRISILLVHQLRPHLAQQHQQEEEINL